MEGNSLKRWEMRKKKYIPVAEESLSETWQELLGETPDKAQSSNSSTEEVRPILKADPWDALVQAKGTEVIDLQRVPLRISDQEVEHLLQHMQESDLSGK